MTDHANKMSTIFAEPFGKSKGRPATVKAEWAMPSGVCPECGADLLPIAIHDGAGEWATIGPSLECPDESCRSDIVFVDWPFVEDKASCRDFRDLGFKVIVA